MYVLEKPSRVTVRKVKVDKSEMVPFTVLRDFSSLNAVFLEIETYKKILHVCSIKPPLM